MHTINRRTVLTGAAATLAAARAAFPAGAHAQGAGPEINGAQLGYIALSDAAALVAAKDLNLFAKYGMPEVEVQRQGTWAATVENIALGGPAGGIDGAHLLTPLAYLISLGAGQDMRHPVPLQILARLNSNGQSITISNTLKNPGIGLDAAPLKAALASASDNRVGMTFRGGTHDLWLRYWLAAAGINPDKDVQMDAAAPRDVVSYMRVGSMKACCVGEPWSSVLVRQDVGTIACDTSEIWKDHPEKSFVMRAEWVAAHPRAAVALTAALIEAQRWSEKPDNKPALAEMLARRLNVTAADILPRLQGVVQYGDGRRTARPAMRTKYWADGASYPYQSHDLWFLTENIRWGIIPASTETQKLIAAVNRQDIWRSAAAAADVPKDEIPAGMSRGKETFFDGVVFDPADPARYLADVKIKSVRA